MRRPIAATNRLQAYLFTDDSDPSTLARWERGETQPERKVSGASPGDFCLRNRQPGGNGTREHVPSENQSNNTPSFANELGSHDRIVFYARNLASSQAVAPRKHPADTFAELEFAQFRLGSVRSARTIPDPRYIRTFPKLYDIAMQAAVEPFWWVLKDEELLAMRICDLGLSLEDSELKPRVDQLYEELAAHGVSLRPDAYLGDEWFSPEGVPAIAIPFYLAHPRLKALELHQMMEVEGGTLEWCQMLLRHECGHAIDHAYRFSSREDWRMIFGSPETEYAPETYTPRPYSKSFVRHLPNWYAQAHPDEDFAETFAVWLASASGDWRRRYQGWKALEKLEYVNTLMQEATGGPPPVTRGRRISEASKLRRTLARHYAARRRLYAEDFPDFYDADLRQIFGKGELGSEPAVKVMRRHRNALIQSIVQWTGQRKYIVSMLVRKVIERCRELRLMAPSDSVHLHFELASYLATLVTNHLYTGRFKRSV